MFSNFIVGASFLLGHFKGSLHVEKVCAPLSYSPLRKRSVSTVKKNGDQGPLVDNTNHDNIQFNMRNSVEGIFPHSLWSFYLSNKQQYFWNSRQNNLKKQQRLNSHPPWNQPWFCELVWSSQRLSAQNRGRGQPGHWAESPPEDPDRQP